MDGPDFKRQTNLCDAVTVQDRMPMNDRLDAPRDRIAAFCRRWHITELALFGSVLRDDFCSDSDVDVLVSFEPQVPHTLLDIVRMQDELSEVFGRRVDLIERAAVEKNRNYIRRNAILRSAETIYAG